MIKTPVGETVEGETIYNYALTEDEHEAGFVLYATGLQIQGTFGLPSGAKYDVNEYMIPVKREDVAELHHEIHEAHRAAGRIPANTPKIDMEALAVLPLAEERAQLAAAENVGPPTPPAV